MSFKKLNLNRSSVEKYLADAAETGTLVNRKSNAAGSQVNCEFVIDGKACLLIFYFKLDGTTTINCTGGKCPEVSEALATEIVDTSKISDIKQAICTFKMVAGDDFALVREYIVEEIPGSAIEVVKDTNEEIQLKIRGISDDRVALKYWKNTGTTLLQGKPLPIFQAVKLIFSELLPEKNIIEAENKAFNITLTVRDCRSSLEKHMPKAYPFLDDKIKKIMSPSLTLDCINGDYEDYSMFCFPALKGLEGYIRQLIHMVAPDYRSTRNIGSLFSLETPYTLADHLKIKIGCADKISALEKTYNFYHSKRHPYFHVSSHIQSAPVIERKEDAQALNAEVFDIIEATYRQIT